MPQSFDVSARDLSQDAAQPLVYKDKKGNLYCDENKGFFAAIGRWITSIAGFRDYKLEHIIKDLSNNAQAMNDVIGQKNIEFLCGKLAKSCGIQDATYKTMVNAEKLLNNTRLQPRTVKTEVESFFAQAATAPKLQKQLIKFQAKLPSDSTLAKDAGKVLERMQISSKWVELGLDMGLLNNDFEGAKFLVKTRLIYSIVGYQNSTEEGPQKHELKVDSNNHIMIKKEGKYVPACELDKEYSFDKLRQEVVSKENPKERWNYFSPNGLVPIDRWEYEKFEPIEELSPNEMKELLAHAESFFKGDAPPANIPRDAVIQIFTNPRKALKAGDNPLLTRLDASFPVHAAIRVITSDGKVYSTGFGSTVEEDQLADNKMMATINGLPTMLDYEEFRKHEGRIVTSIPITTEACNQVLKTLQSYHDQTIRFNIVSQNCTTLAVDALNEAGQKVNNTASAMQFMQGILPSPKAVPVIGVPVRTISQAKKAVKEKLPPKLQQASHYIKSAIEFIPSRLATVFANVVVFGLGGSKGTALPEDKTDAAELLEKEKGLQDFGAAIRSPVDIVRSKPSTMSSSLLLIQWQLQQGSTVVHPYGKKPAMGILPPKVENDPELAKEQESRRAYFTKKYLHNYGLE